MRVEQDYYDVLGVRPDASGDEIKRAYRALARRLHPDVADTPTASGFQELVAAYEVLSHPRKRSLYDRLGFGGRRPPAQRSAPAGPPIDVTLEWYEAERGAAKPLEFEETLVCAECAGLGVPRGVAAAECVRCRGTGRLSSVTESPTIRLLNVRTCPVCDGRGHAPAPPCLSCRGNGTITTMRLIRVRTPPGVRDGDLIQIDGVARRFRVNVGARAHDSRVVLWLAGAALLCALGFLLYLFVR